MAYYDKVVSYTINVNPVKGSGQTSAVKISEVDKTLDNFKNLIMENVAFYMADKKEQLLVESLESRFTNIVERQLARMGRQINQLAVGIKDNAAFSKTANPKVGGAKFLRQATGPQGTLTFSGAVSKSMTGLMNPVKLSDGTGPWAARSEDYLRARKREGSGTAWFKRTGELGRYLANPSTYTQAYGGVRVKYTKYPRKTQLPNVVGISRGIGGRRAKSIRFGKVEVSVLGRITSDMLSDPGQRQPSAWHTGLFGALDDKQAVKLLNVEEFYRPFLGHFLSFYLTRVIPNAIFLQIEKVIANAISKEVTLG
jgi:hypothetical protein